MSCPRAGGGSRITELWARQGRPLLIGRSRGLRTRSSGIGATGGQSRSNWTLGCWSQSRSLKGWRRRPTQSPGKEPGRDARTMPYLLISTQIRMVSTRCSSLGVGFGPRAGGRCRPHLGASLPGHACGCRDAEAAWDTPPAGGGEEGWNSDPAWILGLGSSGGRAPPAPGRGTTCVRPRHSGVPGACGSGPTCLREVEASERDSESPALSSAATTALHRAAPPGNEGWEEWTNLRKRGLKKGCATTLRPLCQVARLQLRPAPLGTSRKSSSETLEKKEKKEPGDDQEG